MVRVAGEMERTGFQVPLLIGGATTSRLHTSLKIDPAYHGPVVHVADASRASGVISNLMSTDLRAGFLDDLKVDYARVVESYQRANTERDRVSIEQARANRFQPTFDATTVAAPTFTGHPRVRRLRRRRTRAVHRLDAVLPHLGHPLAVPRGARPIPSSPRRPVRCTTTRWRCSTRSSPTSGSGPRRSSASGRPTAGTGDDVDDIIVYTDETRTEVRARLHGLRQQAAETGAARVRRTYSISDFVAPIDSGVADYVGGFVVTAGPEEIAIAEEFETGQRRLLLDPAQGARRPVGRGVRRADARAGPHRTVGATRPTSSFDPAELLSESFRGVRPAPGYPAQPDHTEKVTLFELLDAPDQVGVVLTESFAMWPGSSVSGLYLAHPESRYFGVGKIRRDQLESYAARKGWTIEEAETHLAPVLDGSG